MEEWTFICPTKIYFKNDGLKDIGNIIKDNNYSKIFLIYGTKSFRLPYAAFFFVKIARTGKPISTRMIPPTATFLASGPAMNSWFSRTYRPETIAMIGITGYAGTL